MKNNESVEVLTIRLHRAGFILNVCLFFAIVSMSINTLFTMATFGIFAGGAFASFVLKTYFEYLLGYKVYSQSLRISADMDGKNNGNTTGKNS